MMNAYPTIRAQVDVVCRPNGRFYVMAWGKPVAKADFADAILYLDLTATSMSLYFYHCATEGRARRRVVIAESDRINGFMVPALAGQMLVDFLLIDDRYTLDNLRVEGIQNFMATCRKLA
ncbi:MAG: hypothetical protein DI537_05300 [Stutzerimonas stutzeri]|nr:MAG: hypothetical protein DI537_05300 [Stutzerimonas stutzeri]